MKRLLFLHPVIFAAISPVILYVSMSNVVLFIPPGDVVSLVLFATVIGLLLYAIAYGLTRDPKTASVSASLFVLGLLYIWQLFIVLIGLALVSAIIARVVLKKLRFEEVCFILGVISVIVSGYYLYRFFDFAIRQPAEGQRQLILSSPLPEDLIACPEECPDIYYIILDGYGRADMLETIHGFDNSDFVAALEQRGFVVPARSQSNYPRTLLSLASSMNFQYLDTMAAEFGDSSLWWPAQDAIQNSQVRKVLEQEGYHMVFISSGWDLTDIRTGDYYLKPYRVMLRNFQSAFISWTNLNFLGEFQNAGISFPSDDMLRRVILYNFETLPAASTLPGPKFVFSHIMAPHPPYIFDSRGEPVDQEYPYPRFGSQGYSEYVPGYRQGYLEQLRFVNQKILEVVDGILAHSKTPPVIILQADHGPDIFMNYDNLEAACLYERYSILSAYHLPGVNPDLIPVDVSPVNTFRLVLNHYFGARLELLPERRYYSTNASLYRFEDVTDLSELKCELPAELLP